MKRLTLLFVLAQVASVAYAEGQADKFGKPSLGIFFAPLDDELLNVGERKLKWPTRRGMLAAGVVDGTPAHKAGIKSIDIVTHIDGQVIDSQDAVTEAAAKLEVGKPVQVKYQKVSEGRGRVRWRSAMAMVTPATRFDVINAQVATHFDDVTGVTIYKPKEQPEDPLDNEMYCTLMKHEGKLSPYLGLRYRGDDWLFVDSIIISIGKQRFTIDPEYSDFKRDNSAGRCWEWCDVKADPTNEADVAWKALSAVRDTRDVKVTYIGDKYRKDREVSAGEIYRLWLMLDYFEATNK